MIPFVIVVILICCSCNFAFYMPASEFEKEKNYSQTSFLFISFLEQLFFIFSIYSLRNINDDFSMTKELTIAMIVYFVTPIFTVFPQNLFDYSTLPGLLRNLFLLGFSFIYPLACSYLYKDRSEPLTTEMLNSLELMLQSKVTLNYFEGFLRDIEGSANDSFYQHSGFQLLQLFMKCETYLNCPERVNKDELISELLRSEAVPMSYTSYSKETFESHVLIAKEKLLNVISDEYFENFKKSRYYPELRRIIHRQEIYTGRLLTIGLNMSIYSHIRN